MTLDFNNADHHTWPCPYSTPGSYDIHRDYCQCDLPERQAYEWYLGRPGHHGKPVVQIWRQYIKSKHTAWAKR